MPPQEREKMDGQLPGLCCPYCSDSFKRKEHLDRHLRRHSGSKPFQCKYCAKSFSRRDTLVRHLCTHGVENAGRTAASSGPPLLQRRAQACRQCAKSKQRCSGGIPCAPCERKGLDCQYPFQGQASLGQMPNSADRAEASTPSSPSSVLLLDDRMLVDALSPAEANFNTSRLGNYSANEHTTPQVASTPELQIDSLVDASDVDFDFEAAASGLSMLEEGQPWNADALLPPSYPFLWTINESDADHLNLDCSDMILVERNEGPTTVDQPHITIQHAPHLPPRLGGSGKNKSNEFNPCTSTKGHHSLPCQTAGDQQYLIFPQTHPGDENTILAEDFCHVKHISSEAHQMIRQASEKYRHAEDTTFPSLRLFHTFAQLYFEFFDKQFPMIHPSALDQSSGDSWILLLAVAAVGCQYSSISNAEQYAAALQEFLHRAVAKHLPQYPESASVPFVQGFLLSQICLMFGGSKNGRMKLQYERNTLISLCRGIAAHNIPAAHTGSDFDGRWKIWLVTESRTRLLHCVFKLECFQLILSDIQPIISLHNLVINLPSDESIWRCRNAQDWHSAAQSRRAEDLGVRTKLDYEDKTEAIKSMNCFAKEMYALNLYMEERSVLDKISSSPFWRLFMSSPSTAHRGPNNAPFNASQASPEIKKMTSSVEDAFETLFDASLPGDSGHGDAMFHTLSILRRVPLRHLYAFSGWQATEVDVEVSKKYLRTWVRTEPASTRWCLWHAVMALKLLKSKQYFGCDDAFHVLIATLILWAFDLLSEPSDLQSSVSRGAGWDGDQPPVRIDRLSGFSSAKVWAEAGRYDRIHMTGIGILRGPDSATQLLKDCCKILLSRTAWSGLCRGIAYAIEQVLRGKRPCPQEDA